MDVMKRWVRNGNSARRPNSASVICFESMPSAETLVKAGARVLGDGKPKIGAHGLPIIFLHPKDFDGTLIELEEVKPEFEPV